MISDQSAKQFKKIYKKHFGIDLNFDDAKEKAEECLDLFKILIYPLDEAGGMTHTPEKT